MDWVGNENSVFKTLGASNHVEHDRAENDYYATDPIAIDLLLTKETPRSPIWECACGEGHLSKRLIEHGLSVYSTDLVNRGYGEQMDFLTSQMSWGGDILTNPPYKFATEFVLQALNKIQVGQKVFMFLKVTYLAGQKRWKILFNKFPPKTVYIFRSRVNCAMNGKFSETSGAVDFAWFVWEKGFQGKPTIEWI